MKKKLFIILTVILMLIPLAVSAQTEWQYYKGSDTLYYGEDKYTKQEIAYGGGVLPSRFLVYRTESDRELFYVHIPQSGYTSIAFLNDYTSYVSAESLFVNDEGKRIVEDFNSGKFTSYMLFEDNCYNTEGIAKSYINMLDTLPKESEEVNVISLENLPCYQVAGLDETGTLYHIHGGIYKKYSDYYYVNYDELDNSYFNSDGEFSYRRGTVEVVKVPGDIKAVIDKARFEYEDFRYTETFDAYNTTLNNTKLDEIVIFWISSVILGYLLPIIPFVLSIVFAHSKKALYPKRWYLLTACTGVWMLLSTSILIMTMLMSK